MFYEHFAAVIGGPRALPRRPRRISLPLEIASPFHLIYVKDNSMPAPHRGGMLQRSLTSRSWRRRIKGGL
jgi:hypothetical protein